MRSSSPAIVRRLFPLRYSYRVPLPTFATTMPSPAERFIGAVLVYDDSREWIIRLHFRDNEAEFAASGVQKCRTRLTNHPERSVASDRSVAKWLNDKKNTREPDIDHNIEPYGGNASPPPVEITSLTPMYWTRAIDKPLPAIVHAGHPILRQLAASIPQQDIATTKMHRLVHTMVE